MENKSIKAREETSAVHVYINAKYIDINNVNVQVNSSINLLSYPSNLVDLSSSNTAKVVNGLKLMCPSRFHINPKRQFVITASGVRKYKYIGVNCVSCPKDSYSLRSNVAYLSSTAFNTYEDHIFQQFKCLHCPIGAICNERVTAANNFWDTKKEPQN